MRPTCTDCAIKHLSQASILQQESRHGYPDHIYYARGHMAEAEAELAKLYPVHSDLVRTERKQLEENPEYTPDFTALMTKIDEECEVCALAGNPRSVENVTSCEQRIHSCIAQVSIDPRVKNPEAVCRASIKCNPGNSHPLKSKKIKKTVSKKVERFVTPEAASFRTEAAKLDNWLFHKRITEYFTEGGNPENPRSTTQFQPRGSTLPGRQMWLLKMMLLRSGIDTHEIDGGISYWANKAAIEALKDEKLHLTDSGEKSALYRTMAKEAAAEKKEEAEALADYMRYLGKNH